MAKSLLFAGVARNMLRRTTANLKQGSRTLEETNQPHTTYQPVKQPMSKRVGAKISMLQDSPKNFVEKVNTMKDAVKNAPTNAKYKALQMRNNYDDGRLGTEIKNKAERSKRVTQQQLAQQQRLEALKQVEQRKKEDVRNQLAAIAPRNLIKTRIPSEKSGITHSVRSTDAKEKRPLPIAKTSFNAKQTRIRDDFNESKHRIAEVMPKQTAISQPNKKASAQFNDNRSEKSAPINYSLSEKVSKETIQPEKYKPQKEIKPVAPQNKVGKKRTR